MQAILYKEKGKQLIGFIFFSFFSFAGIGQVFYSGVVVDQDSKERVPYATIGLIKENTGVNADENGVFKIQAKYPIADSLIVSSIGYQTKILALGKPETPIIILLEEKQITLKQVSVSNVVKSKSIGLNSFSSCSINYYTSTGAITQIAQHFQAPKPNMYLDEINLCKQNAASVFRLRLYSMDSLTKMPSQDLVDTIIEVKSSRKSVYIDLKDYNILIPGQDFFIAIEWLYIAENAYEEKVKINGRKFKHKVYNPLIGFRKRDKDDQNYSDGHEVWMLKFNGKWIPAYSTERHINLLISPKLSY